MTSKSRPATVARGYKSFGNIACYAQSPFLLLIRLYWGWQFAQTGWGKLHNLPQITTFFTSLNLPFPAFTAHFVAGVEFVGCSHDSLASCSPLICWLPTGRRIG